MKSTILALVCMLALSSAFASSYKIDEIAIEAAFEISEDLTAQLYGIGPLDALGYNASNTFASAGEKSQTTAAIIAFATTVAGGTVAWLVYWTIGSLTGIGLIVCAPIWLLPLVPWHRIYLGTGGKTLQVVALYCVTIDWCGWLSIIDGIMLLIDDTESKYIDNSKYLMWVE